MASYPSLRPTSTFVQAGSLTGDFHGKVVAVSPPAIGTFTHGPQYDIRAMVYSRVAYPVRMYTWFDTTNVSGPGITMHVTVEIDTGDGSPASGDNFHSYPNTPVPLGKENSFDMSGSWSVSVDVDEVGETYVPDTADANGFPEETLVDGSGFVTGYGSAEADGLPSQAVRFLEVARSGSVITATMTVGLVTTTVTKTLTADIEIGYGVWPILDFGWTHEGGSSSITWQTRGNASAPSDSTTDGHTTISCGAASGVGTVSASGDGSGSGRGDSDSIFWPDTVYGLNARLRSFEAAYPNSRLLRVQDKRRLSGGGTWDPSTSTIALSPSASTNLAQRWHDVILETYDGSSPGLLTSSKTDLILEALPFRCWLDTADLSSGMEDSRDWRCQIRGYSWDAMTLAHAATTSIDPCTATTHWTAGAHTTLSIVGGRLRATASGGAGSLTLAVPSTARVWEGYRYLRLNTRGDADHTLSVALAGHTWSADAPTTATDQDLDLCCAGDESATVEGRDTRFPIADPGGYPINDDPSVGYALGWGVNFCDSVVISGIPDGGWIDLGGLSLARQASAELTLLLGFLDAPRGWTSPTDNTYVWPYAKIETDPRRLTDWPAMAHVVPTGGGAESYVYYSISQLRDQLAYVPGLTATLLADPGDGFHSSGLPALQLGAIGATFVNGGTPTWTDWINRDITSSLTIRAQDLWDEVSVYPGAGDVWTGGAYYVPTDIPVSKSLRGQAEGLAFKDDDTPFPAADVVAYVTADPTTIVGTSITGTRGDFRTGTPYGHGNVDHTTEFRQGEPTYLHDHEVWANRRRARTSFRKGVTVAKALGIDSSWPGHLHVRAYHRDPSAIYIGLAGNSEPIAWDDHDSTLTGSWARVRYHDGHRDSTIQLIYGDGTTAYFAKSSDNGFTWSSPVTLGTFTTGDFDVSIDGTRYFYMRASSNTIHCTVVDAQGNTIVDADTNITDAEDKPIAVRVSHGAQGKLRPEILYSSSGSLVHVVCTGNDPTQFA